MDRVFLDANVLFSAAYIADSGLLQLWRKPHVKLITSAYALAEAGFNLSGEERLRHLDELAAALEIVPEQANYANTGLLGDIDLPDKDVPIMAAAIAAGATHLLTGDKRHFGRYFGKKIRGVLIQTPAEYLAAQSRSRKGAQQP